MNAHFKRNIAIMRLIVAVGLNAYFIWRWQQNPQETGLGARIAVIGFSIVVAVQIIQLLYRYWSKQQYT